MRILLIVAFLLMPAIAFGLDADEMFTDPVQEERARDIGRQLRCLKCRNQSIFDSNAGIAKDLRVVVRERMVAGDSDQEILDYVQERFGDYVLLNPKITFQTMLLWGAPFFLTAVAALGLAGYLRGRARSEEASELTESEHEEAQAILKTGGG